MGHTNETNNLHLPQFVANDKPTFLGDINGAMLAIDNAYGTISAEATGAATTAQNAATAAAGAVETASGAVATAQQAATDATAAEGVANTAAATANNAQSTAVLAKSTADTAAADAAEAKAAAIKGSVSVTADGVKTYGALLNELALLVDFTKVDVKTTLSIGLTFLAISSKSGDDTTLTFGSSYIATDDSHIAFSEAEVSKRTGENSIFERVTITFSGSSISHSNLSSQVPPVDTVIEINY